MPKIEKQKTERILGVTDISEFFFVTNEIIHAWTKKIDIPTYRVGKCWMFDKAKLEAWVKSGNSNEVVLKEKIL